MFSYVSRAAAALGMMCAQAVFSGPALTTIQDILYRADGTRYEGTVNIKWSGFQTPDGASIAMQAKTLQITNGVLKVKLTPTTSWAGANYTVTYNSQGTYQYVETWSVPSSTTPLRIKDVRVSPGSVVGGGPAPVTAVAIADVTGLTNELAIRPSRGSGYEPSRAAVIDSTGNLAAAVGSPGDCVRVDGTSGPCGSGAQGSGPSFVDSETPSGVVNGANDTFHLTFPPTPVASLELFRNGLRMKDTVDYASDGDTVRFVPEAIPQGGDILTASYRYADPNATGGMMAPAQVVCSAAGTSTSATTPAELGSCTVPPNVLYSGDRVEIRFDFAREGGTTPYNVQVLWGASLILSRGGTADDQLMTGRGEIGLHSSGAQWSVLTWGGLNSPLSLVPATGAAPDNFVSGLRISFRGQLSTPAPDKVTLRNFTVIRYPAQYRP